MAISTTPFAGDGHDPNRNRIRRITFMVGSCKTVAHLDHQRSGSVAGYGKPRDDSIDPANIRVPERNTYVTEEE